MLPAREKKPLVIEKIPNLQWALDFMHDSLYCGKRFRTLNIIDEGTRECLAIEVDTSLPVERVIRVLERFNGSFRREFLNAYLFESLSQVREMVWFWLQDYNLNRTHKSLNNLPLETYRKQLKNSNLTCLN